MKDGTWCVDCTDITHAYGANCNACSDTECTVNYLLIIIKTSLKSCSSDHLAYNKQSCRACNGGK